ncbi:MAG: hypothetical protein LUQ32_10780 [Methanomicrobiales archaeon]|nr:hypothetical protein [Methanomicrobiales archaeon]
MNPLKDIRNGGLMVIFDPEPDIGMGRILGDDISRREFQIPFFGIAGIPLRFSGGASSRYHKEDHPEAERKAHETIPRPPSSPLIHRLFSLCSGSSPHIRGMPLSHIAAGGL